MPDCILIVYSIANPFCLSGEVVVKESENFDDLELVIRGTIAGVSIRRVPTSAYSHLKALCYCSCSYTDVLYL